MKNQYISAKLSKEFIKNYEKDFLKLASTSKYTKGIKLKDLHVIFGIIHNNSLVGFAGMTCYHGFWGLRACVVHPKHRGNNLQKILIERRLDFAKEKGVKWVNVWASPKNSFSLNNLIDSGFKFVNEKPKVYGNIECVKLRKFL